MRTLALAFVLGSGWLLGQSQLPAAVKERIAAARAYTAPKISSASPQARIGGLFRPDSTWREIWNAPNWIAQELTTYIYTASGRSIADSLYQNSASGWELEGYRAYIPYTQGAFAEEDSLVSGYYCNPTCEISYRETYTRTALPGNRKLIQTLFEEWNSNDNKWDTLGCISEWFSLVSGNWERLDSLRFSFGDCSVPVYFSYIYFYRPDRQTDSISVYGDFSALAGIPLLFRGYEKFFYDAQARLVLRRDTQEANVLNAGWQPSSAGYIYFFYSGNATKPERDSSISIEYGGGPSSQSIRRTRYIYDANGNPTEIYFDTCSTSPTVVCNNSERERYSYRQFAASIGSTSSSSLGLPPVVAAGSSLELPAGIGRSYRLWDASGRLLLQGDVSPQAATSLQLPAQAGLYILQVDYRSQRILIVP